MSHLFEFGQKGYFYQAAVAIGFGSCFALNFIAALLLTVSVTSKGTWNTCFRLIVCIFDSIIVAGAFAVDGAEGLFSEFAEQGVGVFAIGELAVHYGDSGFK